MFKFLFKSSVRKYTDLESELILAILLSKLYLTDTYDGVHKFFMDVTQTCPESERHLIDELTLIPIKRLGRDLKYINETPKIRKIKKLWNVRSYKCDFKCLVKFMES